MDVLCICAVVELTTDIQTLERIDIERELLVKLVGVLDETSAFGKSRNIGFANIVAVRILYRNHVPVTHNVMVELVGTVVTDKGGTIVVVSPPAGAVAECQPIGNLDACASIEVVAAQAVVTVTEDTFLVKESA